MVMKPKTRARRGSIMEELLVNTPRKIRYGSAKKAGMTVPTVIGSFLALLFLMGMLFRSTLNSSSTTSLQAYQRRSNALGKKSSSSSSVNGLYLHQIQASAPLIFPHVEHASILKEMGIPGLYIMRREGDGSSKFVFKREDKPLSDEEIKATKDHVFLVKRSFLDHGKMVYTKTKNHPDTVIVTLIDFDRYESGTLVKIVQNKVDYAQAHNYGVYVRWIQEFVPLLENQQIENSRDQTIPLVMRAAMNAFPHAKNFIFMSEETMVMETGKTIQEVILNPDKLVEKVEHADHNNNRSPQEIFDNTDMIFMNDGGNSISFSTFLLKSTDSTKAFLDYLADPIIRDYRWLTTSDSYTNTISSHGAWKKRTQFVNIQKFSPTFDPNQEYSKHIDGATYYSKGDFMTEFSACTYTKTCPIFVEILDRILKPTNK